MERFMYGILFLVCLMASLSTRLRRELEHQILDVALGLPVANIGYLSRRLAELVSDSTEAAHVADLAFRTRIQPYAPQA